MGHHSLPRTGDYGQPCFVVRGESAHLLHHALGHRFLRWGFAWRNWSGCRTDDEDILCLLVSEFVLDFGCFWGGLFEGFPFHPFNQRQLVRLFFCDNDNEVAGDVDRMDDCGVHVCCHVHGVGDDHIDFFFPYLLRGQDM